MVPPSPPPRIGISTYREPAAWGRWSQLADLLPTTYADAIWSAGGVPLLLPPAPTDPDTAARAAVGGVHAVVLAGGADVDPTRYGEAPGPHTDAPRVERDGWELALVMAALEGGVPILGVCRGLQLLNVALGGTLTQHLPDTLGSDLHCLTAGKFGTHHVVVQPGSRIDAIMGREAQISTHHHQAVATLAPGLRATAWADDGVVEAAEATGALTASWVLGVQWHPEVAGGSALFAALVAAAHEHRLSRSPPQSADRLATTATTN